MVYRNFVAMVLGMWACAYACGESIPRVIFDTDMTGDCDDVGALAVLHALADHGEVKILGCIASFGNDPYIAGCIDAINTYYGRGDLPIGAEMSNFGRPNSLYTKAIATDQARYGNDIVTKSDVPDHVTVYRMLLADQPEKSVTVVTVGRLKGLHDLLVSKPDATSALTGEALIQEKVVKWVCMGGRYPNTKRERSANFGSFGGEAYTKPTIENWRLPVIFTGFEIGRSILTGGPVLEQSDDNPVACAYRLWFAGSKGQHQPYRRPSWDQTGILIAVRGTEPYWDVVSTGYNHVYEGGINEWLASPDKDHGYVVERTPPEEIAIAIDELMAQRPKRLQSTEP